MSFEGYSQYWCPNEHYWEGGIVCAGHIYTREEYTCSVCGKVASLHKIVDMTNHEEIGRIDPIRKIGVEDKYLLPSQAMPFICPE